MIGARRLIVALLVAAAPAPAHEAHASSAAVSPSTTSAAPARLHGLSFAPFDAGAARPVTRQGTRGTPRRAHPFVGAAGHIPGAGPPPPSLRLDPDLPELATSSPNAAPGLSSNPLHLAALFYANFLTRTDGPRCQHLPTCSRFASQAVARHGLLGIPMGLDRVIQPPMSSALRPLPDVEYAGVVRHFDPLENYEWWFPERFTGFPPLVPEEPLVLDPDAAGDAPVPVSP
jgi:putative component of membrane protein insertase Oxa1/YidC/SpoIIIJ protein YidD